MHRPHEPSLVGIVVDLLRARREGVAGISRRQRARLIELVAYARSHSPFYRGLYAELPEQTGLSDLPPVSKPQLMAAFDEWVCDPRITLADVRVFVGSAVPAGMPYLDEYFVCSTSGTKIGRASCRERVLRLV